MIISIRILGLFSSLWIGIGPVVCELPIVHKHAEHQHGSHHSQAPDDSVDERREHAHVSTQMAAESQAATVRFTAPYVSDTCCSDLQFALASKSTALGKHFVSAVSSTLVTNNLLAIRSSYAEFGPSRPPLLSHITSASLRI